MFLFAQTNSQETANQIAFWIGYVIGNISGLLILTVIISGIFHLVSKISKNQSIRFLKVFPWVFIVLFVLIAISTIQRMLAS